MPYIPVPSGLQTRCCFIGENAIQHIPEQLRQTWPEDALTRPIRLVADTNTWKAAGAALESLLKQQGFAVDIPVIFPASTLFHADYRYIELLRETLKGHRPIAVGSGTINDLVKRTAFELELDGYLCCATASSVDGYTSAGAAIVKDGFKQTLPCPAPLVIVADSALLQTAPFDMTSSGYADLLAKVPAGGDWLIADQMGEHPIDATAWEIVQKNLRSWIDNAEGLKAGASDAYANLFNGLCQTGFSMQYLKDSRPASGAEHLFSHYWEMLDIRKNGLQPSHGHKVGVGTLITTAMMEEVFFNISTGELREMSLHAPEITAEMRSEEVTRYLAGTPFEDNARKISREKLLTGNALRQRREQLIESHDIVAGKLRKQLLSFDEIKRRFQLLGCPVCMEDIGLKADFVEQSTRVAGMIRKRYTILDVVFELGILPEIARRVALRV